jgi:hypothetical protein
MKNKRIYIIIIVCLALLSIPLIAMQFTSEVNWTLSDFIIMGMMLLFTGFIFEFILRTKILSKYKLILSILLFCIFLFIWAELAVGIIGSPFSGS